eukprot:Em0007g706a
MTDEETDEGGSGFIQHKLTWRSDALKKLVCVLDKRDKGAKAEGSAVRMKAQEKRTVGSPSRQQPPKYEPQWTTCVSPDIDQSDSSSSSVSDMAVSIGTSGSEIDEN